MAEVAQKNRKSCAKAAHKLVYFMM